MKLKQDVEPRSTWLLDFVAWCRQEWRHKRWPMQTLYSAAAGSSGL